MALTKVSQVNKFLKDFHPQFRIILFYGDNYGFVAETAKKYATLASRALNLDINDHFTVIKYQSSALEEQPGTLTNEATTRSFMNESKIVWVKNLNPTASLVAEIKSILQKGHDKNYLILECKNLKPKAILRSTIESNDIAMAIPCLIDGSKNLTDLIDDITADYNLTVERNAKELLLAILTSDYLIAKNEIEKLCCYCLNDKTITTNAIKELGISDNAIDIYEMVDDMLLGNVLAFNRAYHNYMLNSKNSPQILSVAIWQLNDLQSLVSAYKLYNYNIDILLRNQKIHFKKRDKIRKLLEIWSDTALRSTLIYIHKQLSQSRVDFDSCDLIVHNCCLKIAQIAKKRAISA